MNKENFPTNNDNGDEEKKDTNHGEGELFENSIIPLWRKAIDYEKTKKEIGDAIEKEKNDIKNNRKDMREDLRIKKRKEDDIKKIKEITKEITGQDDIYLN